MFRQWSVTAVHKVEKLPEIRLDFKAPFDENGALFHIATNGCLALAGLAVGGRRDCADTSPEGRSYRQKFDTTNLPTAQKGPILTKNSLVADGEG